jgi:adenylate kinase family enzyme
MDELKDIQIRNPRVEALQGALQRFRGKSPELPDQKIWEELQGLVAMASGKNGGRGIIAFLGIPGSGKSKVIEKVARVMEAPVAHVRELVRVSPELRKREEEFYRKGELIPGIEKEFLEFVFKNRARTVLVDGFPRSLFQALELYRRAVKEKRSVTIVETRLQDGREVFQSFHRQENRAAHREKKGLLFGMAAEREQERILKKISRAIELDLYVIEVLRLAGARIVQLDATQGPSKMLKQFKEAMGLANKSNQDNSRGESD